MRTLTLLPLLALAAGCVDGNYYYSFDLTDPGARNVTRPGQRDTLEDADIKAEILVDPTSFQAILLDVTNKTDVPLQINWAGIFVVGPMEQGAPQAQVQPDAPLPPVEPGAKAVARLVPFSLPPSGRLAAAYDGSTYQLVVPMFVRNQQREYRYHFIVHTKKIS
jgi:hypothetical protein